MSTKMFQQTLYTAIQCRHIVRKGNSAKHVQRLHINKREKSQELELLRYAYNYYLVFFLNCQFCSNCTYRLRQSYPCRLLQ